MRLPNAVVSDLIGSIYDCAIDPQRWPDTLTTLREALNFRVSLINVHSWPSGAMQLHAASGIAPEWLERLGQYGPSIINEWGGKEYIDQLSLDEIYVLSRNTANREWNQGLHRLEWDGPLGIADWLSFGLARDAATLGSLALGRHEDDGPITQAEIDAARLFIPHCQRAVAISRLLDIKTVTAATLEAALDTVAAAVVLVGSDLRIVHTNRAAQAMLSASDALRACGGVLTLSSCGATAALAVAVAQAAGAESAIGRKGMNVPVHGCNGEPRLLHVLPLRHGPLRPGLSPSAVAAVFVAPALSAPSRQMSAMSALFDLTAAEAAVLEQIAAGLDIAQTARELNITTATVKTHVQHLFDKTGVRRQADLIALVSSFALPVRA